MASILAFAGPLMSIAGSAFGMAGGGPQAPPAPNLFQYPGMGDAATGALGGIQQMGATTGPMAGQTLQNLYNNPYAGGAQTAAGRAGAMGERAGLTQFGTGMGLIGEGMGSIPYANMALQQGFDPQGQVYNQLFQQQTDQTRAAEAARGIANTPYGAGVESQSDINFNTAWQQNLLSRMQQGAQTFGSTLGAGMGAAQTGISDITGAPGTFAAGGMMPYNTAQAIGQNQYGALTGYQGIQQQPIQDYLTYLQGGTQAQGQAVNLWNAQAQNAQRQAQMMQQYGQGLGSGLQGLSKAYGQYGNPFSSGWGAANPGAPGSSYYGPMAPGG